MGVESGAARFFAIHRKPRGIAAERAIDSAPIHPSQNAIAIGGARAPLRLRVGECRVGSVDDGSEHLFGKTGALGQTAEQGDVVIDVAVLGPNLVDGTLHSEGGGDMDRIRHDESSFFEGPSAKRNRITLQEVVLNLQRLTFASTLLGCSIAWLACGSDSVDSGPDSGFSTTSGGQGGTGVATGAGGDATGTGGGTTGPGGGAVGAGG